MLAGFSVLNARNFSIELSSSTYMCALWCIILELGIMTHKYFHTEKLVCKIALILAYCYKAWGFHWLSWWENTSVSTSINLIRFEKWLLWDSLQLIDKGLSGFDLVLRLNRSVACYMLFIYCHVLDYFQQVFYILALCFWVTVTRHETK